MNRISARVPVLASRTVAVLLVLGAGSGASAQFVEEIELATLAPPHGTPLNAAGVADYGGEDVATVGDVNGDGHGDLLIGAHFGNGSGIGKAYVVFGGPALRVQPPVDLGQLDGTNGFVIVGPSQAKFFAKRVAAAGDVNGDGYADILFTGAGVVPGLGGPAVAFIVYGGAAIGAGGTLLVDSLDPSTGVALVSPSDATSFDARVAGIGDVNGDGFDDVLVGNEDHDDPTLQLDVPLDLTRVAAADLSGNGAPDLVATSHGPNRYTEFFNSGAGAFDLVLTFPLLSDPSEVLFDDTDLDGNLDMVVATAYFDAGLNEVRGRVTTKANLGNGLFGFESAEFSGEETIHFDTGDVDGDGDADVVAVHHDPAGGTAGSHELVIVRSSPGPPTTPQVLPTGLDPVAVVLGDWDQDGDLDAAVATAVSDTLEFFTNDGTGAYTPGTVKHLPDDLLVLTAADLDNDGDIDLIGGRSTVCVFFRNNGASFTNGLSVPAGTEVRAIETADFDGDGRTDVACAGSATTAQLSVLLNQGGFQFTLTTVGVGEPQDSLSLADFDGDGAWDAATAGLNENTVTISRGLGGGQFEGLQSGRAYVVFGGSTAMSAGLVDVDALNGADGFVIGGAAGGTRLGAAVSGVGDVNGDGFDDFAVGMPGVDTGGIDAGAFSIYFGTPQIGATGLLAADAADVVVQGDEPASLVGWSLAGAGDVNGDGFDDVIAGAPFVDVGADNEVGVAVVLLGSAGLPTSLGVSDLDGTSGYVIQGVADGDSTARRVAGAGDVNDDGRDDIIIGGLFADPNGSASGAAYVIYGSSDPVPNGLIRLADLNGLDGATLNGAASGDRAGEGVAIGDVDDDGVADAIVGAPRADPGGLSSAGSTYIVFGIRRSLAADVAKVSLADGGTQSLSLDATPAYGGQSYLVLGSGSGALPGIPNGDVLIPLNLDPYLLYTISHPNAPPLTSSLGTLDANGRATAAFTLPPGLSPSLVGLTVRHAFVVLSPGGSVLFASNQVPVTLES